VDDSDLDPLRTGPTDNQPACGQDQFGRSIIDFDGRSSPFGHDRTIPIGGPLDAAIARIWHPFATAKKSLRTS
jgi:hypothetical protein